MQLATRLLISLGVGKKHVCEPPESAKVDFWNDNTLASSERDLGTLKLALSVPD